MDLTLRTAQETDASGMIEILNPIIRAGVYTAMNRTISLAEQIQFIRGFPDTGILIVVVLDQGPTLVGLQDILPIEGEDGSAIGNGEISTFVDLNFRRRGIGEELTQYTLQRAREKGFDQIIATIRTTNSAAILFYTSQGFQILRDSEDRIQLIYRL